MSPSLVTTPKNHNVDRMFVFPQYDYESVLRLTPKHSKISLLEPPVNAEQYSVSFSNFLRNELCHDAAFLHRLNQVCCTVDKTWNRWSSCMKFIILNCKNLSITLCVYTFICIYDVLSHQSQRISPTVRVKMLTVRLPTLVICLQWWKFVKNQSHTFWDDFIIEEWCTNVPLSLPNNTPQIVNSVSFLLLNRLLY